ncbi:MAG: ATP-binding cassette domain-containing protein, partial [bacterium]|nr:ATP-binding cassette domain-containing protein [bacterium]
ARFYPAQLSGGQRQRVAIAQQLMCSEHFLIMDEPFSGLDPLMAEEVCKLVTELASADELNTVIVITHDIRAAVAVSDTLWIMGRDYDAEGKPIPGSRIQEQHNLIEMGLAWQEDITLMPEFSSLMRQIRKRFKAL